MRHDRIGLAEEAKAEWDHKGAALISPSVFLQKFYIYYIIYVKENIINLILICCVI